VLHDREVCGLRQCLTARSVAAGFERFTCALAQDIVFALLPPAVFTKQAVVDLLLVAFTGM
jgi:hypothetical protein